MMKTSAGGLFRKRANNKDGGDGTAAVPTGAGAGRSSGGSGGGSKRSLSRRQRRSLIQAAVVLTGLLVGGTVVLQSQTVDVGGLWARAAASLGWSVDRGWAVATNIRALALPTQRPPQWDAVDSIHRLLATEEYPNHNQDCGRVLVYAQKVYAGFGAQMNQMLTAFMVALNEHRAFVVHPHFLSKYSCEASHDSTESFATCFDTDVIIGPPACQVQWGEPGGIKERLFGPDAVQPPEWTRSSNDSVVLYMAPFLQSVKYHGSQPWNQDQPISAWRCPVPVEGPEELRAYFPFAAWKAYAAAWLWRPRVEVGERIDAILGAQVVGDAVGEPEDASEGKGDQQPNQPRVPASPVAVALERPVCALQVRRGDKHVEAPPAPLEQYMALLVNATAEAGTTCRTIFVATDDQVGALPTIKADARSAFPGARVAWLRSENPRAGHQQGGHDSVPPDKRAANTLELLAEMTVLARADVLVGSQSSNVAKLALALRGAEGWRLRTAWSVDGAPPGELWELP